LAIVRGSFVRLSRPRRLIGHFLDAARGVPVVTAQRTFRIANVAAARDAASPRPGWAALFVKAFAAVCARRPELRRTLVAWPWARLFEYDAPIVSVVVERTVDGEPALFLGQVKNAAELPLATVQAAIRNYKTRPIEKIHRFRDALRLAALPAFVRRPLWRLVVNAMPRLKAACLGTHGVSPTTGLGVSGVHIVTPWAIGLHYDAPRANGDLDVRFTIDHRVYDFALAASALAALEQEVCGPILAELRAMKPATDSQSLRDAA
jgi:hypothetical protein